MKKTWALLLALVMLIGMVPLNAFSAETAKEAQGTDTAEAFIHISFDDVTYCIQNLAKKRYSSLFDEPFFGWLKELHETYGAKFSLYTYNNVLKNVPATYAEDFAAASDWMKIGLHADNASSTYVTSTYDQGKAAWNTFVGYVKTVTGTDESVDRMPRLHYFAGTKAALEGMQDATCGALGFLAADDSRNSYYFGSTVSANLYGSDHITDLNNGLVFLTTDMRGDWFLPTFSSANTYDKPVCGTVYDELMYRFSSADYAQSLESCVFFCHEWQIYNGSSLDGDTVWTEDACKFASQYGVEFDYPQNRTFSQTEFDIAKDEAPGDSGEDTEDNANTTTRNGETVAIVTDLADMRFVSGSFSGGRNETPVTNIVGRAVSRYYVLKVNGGETLSLSQIAEENGLAFALKEFKNIPLTAANLTSGGQTYLEWLTEPIKLLPETRYIIVGFKNGDGSANFTQEELAALSSACTISSSPVIQVQPQGIEAAQGEAFSITVEAEGEGLKYQWYYRNAGSDIFRKAFSKGATFEATMNRIRAGREMYCVITDANGNTVTTDTVKLIRIPKAELKITQEPESITAKLGEEFTVTVEAQGEDLTYRWFYRNPGEEAFRSFTTGSNTYTAKMNTARAGRELYCVVTDALGNQTVTETVKLILITDE